MADSVRLTSKQRRRSLFAIFFVACLDNFGFGLVFILFAPLILDSSYGMLTPNTSLNARNLILGLSFAAFPLTQFFGAPLIGDCADRLGRKNAFYITIVGTTIGYAVSAFSIQIHHVYLLIFSRLLTGFFAGNLSICLAAIADFSPDEKTRGKNYGLVGVVWGFSWPLAMLVGGYLSDPRILPFFNPALPFWITAFLSLLSLITVYYYLKETHFGEKNSRIELGKAIKDIIMALKVKSMRPFFVVLFIWITGWGLTVQWYGAYSIEKFNVSQQFITWGLIFQGAFWVLGGSTINLLLLKFLHSRQIALFGILFSTIFVLLSSFSTNFWTFSLFYWISAIGASFSMSNTLNLISLATPGPMQGRSMGLSQSMMSLGWICVPLIGSALGNIDVRLFYIVAAVILLMSCIVLFFSKARFRKSKDSNHGFKH